MEPVEHAAELSAEDKELFNTFHEGVDAAQEFWRIAEPKIVKGYLNDLQDLQFNLSEEGINKGRFIKGWCSLLNRNFPFDHVAYLCFDLEKDDEKLSSKVSRLAHLLLYPKQPVVIDHRTRVHEIDSPSSQVAKPPPTSVSQTAQNEIVAEGFYHQYLHSEQIVKPILQTLESYARIWDPNFHLAPYTSVIAPTMSGKTRLLKELSQHICVVYICVRPPNSTGYPPRTKYPADILLNPECQDLKTQHEILLLAIIDTVVDYFSLTAIAGSKKERLEKWIEHSFPGKESLGDLPFWTDVAKKMGDAAWKQEKVRNGTNVNFTEAANKIIQKMTFIGSNLKVLLAIDEARGLLDGSESSDFSFFRMFRCVIGNMLPGGFFFSVLVDTTSRLSNFDPPANQDPRNKSHRDPSYRLGGKSQWKLYAPIYEIPTFDVNVAVVPPATWSELQSVFRLFSYGSPFWGVYIDSAKQQNRPGLIVVEELSQWAHYRLLGTMEVPITSTSLTNEQAIALLGSTIQPQMYTASHLNTELFSSHGAQCIYIDSSRSILISEYPSQITYSSAANWFLASDDSILIRCIQVLTFTQRQGYISPGDVGELASRIVLLCAMHKTMKKAQTADEMSDPNKLTMPFGHSVRLVDFLLTLTGLEEEGQLELGSITDENRAKLLKDGQIFWNHFVCVDHMPTAADLLRELYRGVAVHCKPYQKGFDQMFAVLKSTNPMQPLHEESISFCGVQVKNEKQIGNLEANSHKWTPGYAGIQLKKRNPYLVLYFSLRPDPDVETSEPKSITPKPKIPRLTRSLPHRSTKSTTRAEPKQKIVNIPNGQTTKQDCELRASLAFYGLNTFPFLSPDVIVALQELLNPQRNILLLHKDPSDSTKEFLKTVSPVVSSLGR